MKAFRHLGKLSEKCADELPAGCCLVFDAAPLCRYNIFLPLLSQVSSITVMAPL